MLTDYPRLLPLQVEHCTINFQSTRVVAGAYRAGEGACNCVLRNVDGETQTWRPMLFLVSLHIAMYG